MNELPELEFDSSSIVSRQYRSLFVPETFSYSLISITFYQEIRGRRTRRSRGKGKGILLCLAFIHHQSKGCFVMMMMKKKNKMMMMKKKGVEMLPEALLLSNTASQEKRMNFLQTGKSSPHTTTRCTFQNADIISRN